ncbi:unnamed protein product [Amaranthus hypochondriacus]
MEREKEDYHEKSIFSVQMKNTIDKKLEKNKLFCNHCKKIGHDNTTCFKIHGGWRNLEMLREEEGMFQVVLVEEYQMLASVDFGARANSIEVGKETRHSAFTRTTDREGGNVGNYARGT